MVSRAKGSGRGMIALWNGVLALVLTLTVGNASAMWDTSSPQARYGGVIHRLSSPDWGQGALLNNPVPPPLEYPARLQDTTPPSEQAARLRVQENYGRIPMHFEPNVGQTAEEVEFLARGPGYTLFLTATEAVFALRKSQPAQDQSERHGSPKRVTAEPPTEAADTSQGAVVRMRLEGARNDDPEMTGLEKLPGISNYFIGNDPEKWRTDVPQYRRVQYDEVYPGIDLVFYGNPQQLEYDFVLAPGADPGLIRIAFEGVDAMRVTDSGDLVLTVAGGEVVQKAPKIYQDIEGQRQEVAGRYVLLAHGQESVGLAAAEEQQPAVVGFQVASYQPEQPLVIDPVLVYSTYLGGSNHDGGYDIAVDGSGNAYVTGTTYSSDFPKVNAKYPNL